VGCAADVPRGCGERPVVCLGASPDVASHARGHNCRRQQHNHACAPVTQPRHPTASTPPPHTQRLCAVTSSCCPAAPPSSAAPSCAPPAAAPSWTRRPTRCACPAAARCRPSTSSQRGRPSTCCAQRQRSCGTAGRRAPAACASCCSAWRAPSRVLPRRLRSTALLRSLSRRWRVSSSCVV
jgi:hypothetical protein